ncbi:hypothetical protein [Methylobacter tundripaludum]|uniref:hypothetical protein n=1 Tax=Methylobacter tundripaludum TaxID=173365 RepID=UPI00123795DD|nr:hypothetical protein [Methylobacter tundripaludum]
MSEMTFKTSPSRIPAEKLLNARKKYETDENTTFTSLAEELTVCRQSLSKFALRQGWIKAPSNSNRKDSEKVTQRNQKSHSKVAEKVAQLEAKKEAISALVRLVKCPDTPSVVVLAACVQLLSL